jgi:hypothetical protein
VNLNTASKYRLSLLAFLLMVVWLGHAIHAADPVAEAADALATGVPDSWRVVASSGTVETMLAADRWSPVQRGDRLRSESRFRTGSNGRATLVRAGDLILLDPDTDLTLPAGRLRGAEMPIQQHAGGALYQVESRDVESQGRFQVETPYLVAGVKGTKFTVIVQQDFATVSVREGSVGVRARASGQQVDLFPGDFALVEGRLGRMEIYRDRSRPTDAKRDDAFERARESRKQAKKLYRRASRYELSWQDLEADPLMMFALDDLAWNKRDTKADRLQTQIQEDQKDLKSIEDDPKRAVSTP